jgi:hypothetical protein
MLDIYIDFCTKPLWLLNISFRSYRKSDVKKRSNYFIGRIAIIFLRNIVDSTTFLILQVYLCSYIANTI